MRNSVLRSKGVKRAFFFKDSFFVFVFLHFFYRFFFVAFLKRVVIKGNINEILKKYTPINLNVTT